MPSGGRGGSAPDLDLETTRLLAREAARQQASLFSQAGFPKGLSPLPPEAFFLFAS